MSSFDDREKGFEKKFAHDEELQFKISARKNKYLGEWASSILGHKDEKVKEYIQSVIKADFVEAGDDDVFRKLKEDLKKYGKETFNREIISLHTTKGNCNFEETKQLFLNNVLSEALDNGEPAFYNSNILGRYMRKDYGNFGRDSLKDT